MLAEYTEASAECSLGRNPARHKAVWQHHIEHAISDALHTVLEETDLVDPGITAEEGMVEQMIAKTQSSVGNMKANLYAHGWDDGVSENVNQQEAQLKSLVARRDEYVASRTTVDALRAQVHDCAQFMMNRTTGELCDLYHGSIRRIDVDFEASTATIHRTFATTTAKIDLAHEEARARARAHASNKVSINEPVDRVSGQVVEPRGFEPLTSSVRGMRSPS